MICNYSDVNKVNPKKDMDNQVVDATNRKYIMLHYICNIKKHKNVNILTNYNNYYVIIT